MTAPWVENAAPVGHWPRLGLAEPWRHRELICFFALRDLKVRYKQAFFGASWALLQPLAGALAFTVLFNGVAGIKSDGGSYFGFALIGFVVWTYFSTSLAQCSDSLVGNAELITKVSFPKLVAPLSSLLPGLLDLAIGVVLAAIWSIVWGDGISVVRLAAALPLGVVLLIVTTVGPGLWLSALTVRYHDARALVTFGVQLLLFVSPVGYPPELVAEPWRDLQFLNPIAGALGLFRTALSGSKAPTVAQVALSCLTAIVLAFAGWWYFRANERELVDII